YAGPVFNIGGSNYNFDPAVAQSGEAPFLATNMDRDFFVAQWAYKAPDDSACEIYMSYRNLDSAWSAPMNITETPNMNEDGEHLAPYIAVTQSGDTTTYTAFSMYWYETGYTGRWPDPTVESSVYMAAVPVYSHVVTGVKNETLNQYSYKLEQNYPNPFNPTTRITYSIPERNNVTLKVYNMLGQEVTTLVNTTKDAGQYEVNFDAAKLASGLYIYKLQAGNFTESRKMMLLK
ncbi:MAG TPA: T9SS type A sorting domain-containing protein, partial [Ignavibacteriaceae bacterium]|nr:T9SS type A sorting domain-containing protein [Ignavibacteriaceae bacterium]